MSQLNAHGWTIFFYTDFRLQWEDLIAKAMRKEGDLHDCYQVFARMLANGKLPDSYESLLAECDLNNISTVEVKLAAEDVTVDETLLPEYFVVRVASALRNREQND